VRRQQGTTTVEFAVVAAAAFLILFGVIEISRAIYVWNTLTEATRRGARIAAVCPVDHAAIKRTALFDSIGEGDGSPLVHGLTADNIQVSYLQASGAPAADYPDTYFVRVEIVNFQHRLLIPMLPITLDVPGFTTTLRAESLGFIPGPDRRECFGTPA
jgi:Flp pilus assembly protein TadG